MLGSPFTPYLQYSIITHLEKRDYINTHSLIVFHISLSWSMFSFHKGCVKFFCDNEPPKICSPCSPPHQPPPPALFSVHINQRNAPLEQYPIITTRGFGREWTRVQHNHWWVATRVHHTGVIMLHTENQTSTTTRNCTRPVLLALKDAHAALPAIATAIAKLGSRLPEHIVDL